jgi:hypothetical protein
VQPEVYSDSVLSTHACPCIPSDDDWMFSTFIPNVITERIPTNMTIGNAQKEIVHRRLEVQ